MWDADFEVHQKQLEKRFQHNVLLGKPHVNMEFIRIFISQETTEFSRAPIINAFDILRANSNDIFVPEFNIEPIKLALPKCVTGYADYVIL